MVVAVTGRRAEAVAVAVAVTGRRAEAVAVAVAVTAAARWGGSDGSGGGDDDEYDRDLRSRHFRQARSRDTRSRLAFEIPEAVCAASILSHFREAGAGPGCGAVNFVAPLGRTFFAACRIDFVRGGHRGGFIVGILIGLLGDELWPLVGRRLNGRRSRQRRAPD